MNQPSITVLCLNPALDVTYNVKTFVPDKKIMPMPHVLMQVVMA